MMNKIEYIYQLYAVPYDDLPIYIGRTSQKLETRLQQHLKESERGNSKKCAGIREILEAGYEIAISVLEEVDLTTNHDAEELWITNSEGRGCVLLNSKRGDSDRLVTIDGGEKPKAWSANLFKSCWEKDLFAVPSGLKGKFINGILFCRKGQSKLYFVHPVYGKRDCLGFTWNNKVNYAINCMVKGTPENARMVEEYKNK